MEEIRKRNTSTGKYQCILVELKKCRIFDILLDRTQSDLVDYWRKEILNAF